MSAATVSIPTASYVIRGGHVGRDRLRVLSGVLGATTSALLDRVGIPTDARCLDVGCGGADVTALLAARVPIGHVVATDRDAVKIDLARATAAPNVELRVEDVAATVDTDERYDVVYARFLLSHIGAAADRVRDLAGLLVPGGVLVVEDVRISGSFCSPASEAFDRSLDIYRRTVIANGGDPDLGPHLPRHLHAAGLTDIGIEVVQPAALTGDAKRIQLLTLAAIRASAVASGVSDDAEIDRIADALESFVERDDTVVTTSQIVQTWGRRIKVEEAASVTSPVAGSTRDVTKAA